ncbi:MAG TPA: serine hydrolase [Puia sp.]|jgi:CubicO group peptidase (beta-lactamase class C family)|nr:serine hydrolase [Puia sp.]
MTCQKISFASMLIFFFLNICLAQDNLLRSLPEEQGVSSADIIKFLDATTKSKTEFHSFILLRHGKVIAEGWWNPYTPELRHTLYSCSKSFTATAIGFALNEKLLSLNDKVVSFFPNDLPDPVTPYLAELTVKDVLMMSDGMDPDPSFTVAARDSNWIKGFLATTIKNEPGTKFLYNSLGTYMLSAIIQKVTGQKTIDYLKPRLFDPLGIKGIDWETDTKGINTGGWGLRVKTADMAKFAELFLQKGNWNGKQILPVSWVEEASTMKIMQDPSAPQSKKDSSDWLQGYCYQMWRCRNNAFRGDGAYGQFMIVMPDQDAALAITAETADMQEEINLVWKYLLPAFKNGKLPDDKNGDKQLHEMISTLALPVPAKNKEEMQSSINGKTFAVESNKMQIQQIGFDFSNDACKVKLQTDKGNYQFNFGDGKWQFGETNMPGPSLVATSIENFSMLYPAKVAGAYTWKDANTLQLVLRYIESPHSETFTCHFDGNKITIDASRSFDFGRNTMVLHGETK